MPWPEEQIDALIDDALRDLALGRMKPEFWLKLHERGISLHQAARVISKTSYIVQYDHHGQRIGFLDPKTRVFVAWKPDYPTEVKTCFVAEGSLGYLKRQYDFLLIWSPN